MVTFGDLQTHFDELIRKGLEGSVFIKRFAAADPEIAALVDATGMLALPAGYADVGHITKADGVSWSRDVDSSDTESLGASSPTRRDVIKDITGLQFTMQESKKNVLELHEGIDLTAVVQTPTGIPPAGSGNVKWDKPDRPATIYYRTFVLFKDGDGADALYFAKWLPRASVTDRGEQKWTETDELQYQVTLTAFVDSAVGTSVRSLWAGPTTTLTSMGFAV